MSKWKLTLREPDWNMTTAAGSSIWDTATESHHKLAEMAVRNAIAASPDPAEDAELLTQLHAAACKAQWEGAPLWVHFADAFRDPNKAGFACQAYLRAVLRLLSTERTPSLRLRRDTHDQRA